MVTRDIGSVTFDTLEKYKIPYDELYFGKPHADMYIDDKALDTSFLDVKTGFYNKKIVPRSFNEVLFNPSSVTKVSSDLSAEIYYYSNIPDTLKDLFPLLIDHTVDNTQYSVEKIDGVTISEIVTSQGRLSPITFEAIMGSIRRIHQVECKTPKFDITNIYSEKLKQRGITCDQDLINYEKSVSRFTCVHGDPVFTNILVNKYNKIKFIDPRGCIGDVYTVYGDPMYDWAKVYQSLIGYDFILMNRPIVIDNDNIRTFEKYFSDTELRNIKIICKSLIQSLIPLHQEHNDKFVELYKSITY
jgi:hypothetical protein